MLDISVIDADFLVTAFTLSSMLRAIFYVPQVVAVARCLDGARSIALSTWWM